jgi:hypothetical protein
VVWVFLFGLTLGAYRLQASASAPDEDSEPEPNPNPSDGWDSARVEYERASRRNAVIPHDVLATTYPTTLFTLQESINLNRDRLRVCKELVMRRAIRSTEYFEISFVIEQTNGAGKPNHLTIERSSFELSSAEIECVTSVFLSFAFRSNAPKYRISYPLCFTR